MHFGCREELALPFMVSIMGLVEVNCLGLVKTHHTSLAKHTTEWYILNISDNYVIKTNSKGIQLHGRARFSGHKYAPQELLMYSTRIKQPPFSFTATVQTPPKVCFYETWEARVADSSKWTLPSGLLGRCIPSCQMHHQESQRIDQ